VIIRLRNPPALQDLKSTCDPSRLSDKRRQASYDRSP